MPNDEANLNLDQIAAELIARAVHGIASSVAAKASLTVAELSVRLGTAFTRYLDFQLKRRSNIKTLLYRETPKFIYSFYISQDLSSNGNIVIENAGAKSLFTQSRHAVLTATGGMGKSTLLRHLFIDTIRYTNFVPFFIELRAINQDGATLESVIADELSLADLTHLSQAITGAMERGQIALLLDGLDEVIIEKRDALAGAIQRMAQQYPELPIIVTSRPDDRFVGWQDFQQFQVKPFTKQKAIALLSRLEYDSEVKTRFAADIEKNLWQTHQSFLSNPLLLTIMLLTYSHNASLPTRMHLFYGQVFETLWNRHDALKDGFKRTLDSCLEKDAFIRILEAFAFKTYWESKTLMNDSEVQEALRFAIRMTQQPCDSSAYLSDLVKSLCILNQDGILYAYSHRSFQEYYAACFLLRATAEHRSRLLPRILASASTDQVIRLLWEMDRGLVEREVIMPVLDRLHVATDGVSHEKAVLEYVKLWCDEIVLKAPFDNNVTKAAKLDVASVLDFAVRHYPVATGSWESENRAFQPVEERAKSVAFWDDYLRSESGSTLTRRHERVILESSGFERHPRIIEMLSKTSFVFSSQAMFALLRLREQIRRSHDERRASLDELFASPVNAVELDSDIPQWEDGQE